MSKNCLIIIIGVLVILGIVAGCIRGRRRRVCGERESFDTIIHPVDNRLCICIIAVKPNPIMLEFLYQLQDVSGYDVYLVCDDNSKVYTDDKIRIIQVDDNICKNAHYISSGCVGNIGPPKSVKGEPISWDKALYYFCNHNNYKYYWFIEDDVLIPTVNTIKNIDIKYPDGDVLSASHSEQTESNLHEWHWPTIHKQHGDNYLFDVPFYNTMACAIRLSNRMLVSIKEFVEKYNTLTYIEYFFNTLAMKSGYNVEAIPELRTIKYRHEWKRNDIQETNLYHPVKDFNQQKMLRL